MHDLVKSACPNLACSKTKKTSLDKVSFGFILISPVVCPNPEKTGESEEAGAAVVSRAASKRSYNTHKHK